MNPSRTISAVEANGKTAAGSLEVSDKPAFWLVDYTAGERRQRNHYLAGPRPFTLSDYRRWLRALFWIAGLLLASAFASCLPRTTGWPLPAGMGGVTGDAPSWAP